MTHQTFRFRTQRAAAAYLVTIVSFPLWPFLGVALNTYFGTPLYVHPVPTPGQIAVTTGPMFADLALSAVLFKKAAARAHNDTTWLAFLTFGKGACWHAAVARLREAPDERTS